MVIGVELSAGSLGLGNRIKERARKNFHVK